MEDEAFPNPFDDPEDKPFASPPPVVNPPVTNDEEPVLTDEMKKFIDDHWKDMDLMEMTRHIFKDDNLKGTSKQGRLVRQYLIAKGYEYKTTRRPEVRIELELTEENKEFITKYAATMKPHEIARVIFKDENLHHFSKEALLVQQYIKSVSPTLIKKDEEYTDEEYTSPKTFQACFKRIQQLTGFNVEEDKLNVKTRKCVEKCLEFLQAPRFVQTVNNLKNVSERAIFESEFIRSVWDKPDLTNDEINLYISLTNEYVIQDRLHRIMGKLNMMLENVTADPDGKISIALADAIKGKSEELHRSLSRQADFTKDLTGKRADRQKHQMAKAKSLVSLVEAFREEAERKNALRFAELRKKKVADEITRLENEDEWNARIFGISREEILE
jgi:hypothetical protein